MSKRLLFGNWDPKPVKFLRVHRKRSFRNMTWTLLRPPLKPSWIEREGLSFLPPEWQEDITHRVFAYYWHPKQWAIIPRSNGVFSVRVERKFDKWWWGLTIFGVRLIQKTPDGFVKRGRRMSKKEMRAWLIEQKFK